MLWELHVHGEEAHGHSMGAGAVAVDVDPAPDPAPPFMCHCGMFLHLIYVEITFQLSFFIGFQLQKSCSVMVLQ